MHLNFIVCPIATNVCFWWEWHAPARGWNCRFDSILIHQNALRNTTGLIFKR